MSGTFETDFVKTPETTPEEINKFFESYIDIYFQEMEKHLNNLEVQKEIITSFFTNALKMGLSINEITPALISNDNSLLIRSEGFISNDLIQYVKSMDIVRLYALAGVDIERDYYVDWKIKKVFSKDDFKRTTWDFCLNWRSTEPELRSFKDLDIDTIISDLKGKASDWILCLLGPSAPRDEYSDIEGRCMIYPYSKGMLVFRFDDREFVSEIQY